MCISNIKGTIIFLLEWNCIITFCDERKGVVIMESLEVAALGDNKVQFSTNDGKLVNRKLKITDIYPPKAQKCGYPNFMLKEIYEQPAAVINALANRLREDNGDVFLEGLNLNDSELNKFERLCLVACDSSWHSALAGRYLLEEYCCIPVNVQTPSEFSRLNSYISEKTLVIPISRSGETANTLGALREARSKGAYIVSICNVSGSSIANESDGVIYTNAGHENGVASSKAFTTQFVVLYLLAIRLGRASGRISRKQGREMIAAVSMLPALVEKTLELDTQVEEIACEFLNSKYVINLGSGVCYPIALESALNLKAISSIYSEGYPVGEINAASLARIDKEMLVFVLAPSDRHLFAVRSFVEGAIDNGRKVIVFCPEGDLDTGRRADFCLHIPWAGDVLSPVLYAVSLQLMAYKFAILKGKNVDKPVKTAGSVSIDLTAAAKDWSQACKIFQRVC